MTSKKGKDLIKKFEALKLIAYDDGVGVWTIGWGTTRYPSGIKVKKGDTCTLKQAEEYFLHDLYDKEDAVDDFVTSEINQNQYDALVSLVYNIGVTAFKNSTILKKVNKNPKDPSIAAEFARWNKGGGRVLNGLVYRRKLESDLYFS